MNENTKMSEEKLFEVFRSLNVPDLRLSDVKNPTKEFVIRVFDTFLRDLHINVASPLLRPYESIMHLDNPELYEEGQSYILLAATMNKILKYFIGSIDITMSDIVAPKPKRTKKIFNFLVIAWGYILKSSGTYLQALETLQPEIQEAENIQLECSELESQYKECYERLSAVKPSQDELRKEFSLKQELFKDYEVKHGTIGGEYQQLKAKEQDLVIEIAKMDVTIAETKEKLSELDQLILTSPEKVTGEVQRIKDAIKDVEEKIQEKELEKKEKKKGNQALLTVQEDLAKDKARLQKILNEQQLLLERCQSLSAAHIKYLEESKSLKDLESDQKRKEEMSDFYEKTKLSIQLKRTEGVEEANKDLERFQRELSEEQALADNLTSSVIDLENKFEKGVASVISIVDDCKAAEAQTETFKTMYTQQIGKDNFSDDCNSILKTVERIFQRR